MHEQYMYFTLLISHLSRTKRGKQHEHGAFFLSDTEREKLKSSGVILTQCLFLPTNPTWNDLGLNPRLHDESHSTNRLWFVSPAVACVVILMAWQEVLILTDTLFGALCEWRIFSFGSLQLFLVYVCMCTLSKEKFLPLQLCVSFIFFFCSS